MVDQKEILEEISPAAKSHGPMKRLYHWVLHWAETPYGTPALFLLSFAESSFFPVPPDVLQIALSVSKPKRSFFYATVSGIGSVLGGILGWMIGFAFWAAVGWFFIRYVPGCSEENIQHVKALYDKWDFWALLGAAFTPIPYKVFTISAGMLDISLWVLVVASSLGRFARFYIVAVCIYFFGPSIKQLLEEYFGIATFLLFAAVVAGFVVIRYLI
jgi:membrane protein YqaA with SNARE-associated domain